MTTVTNKVPDYKIIPLSGRIVFRKDEEKDITSGGIILPESSKEPNLTGRIVAISPDIEDEEDLPIKVYDKILINPKDAVPVEFVSQNKLWIVPIEDVLAVFQKNENDNDSDPSEGESD